jgi:pimeloyl-ACP methyl ester carboxylesterase
MLLWLERYLIFPGSWIGKEWLPPPPGAVDFEVRAPGGEAIGARWHAPTGWAPSDGAILLSHGNGGNLSGRSWQPELWWRHGFKQAMLLYDYPGYGRTAGIPTEVGCYAAGEACYRWLTEEKKVAPQDILLLGESLGGAVAIELATRLPHRAVITMGTFTSIPDMARYRFPFLPAHWLVRSQFDNRAKAPKVRMLIAHGTADSVIPVGQAYRLHEAAAPGSRLLVIEGLGHAPPESNQFFDAVREHLEAPPTGR